METTMTGNTLVIRKDETSNENIKLDYVAVKTAAMTLRAINHKLRQQIVRLLEEHKRMNVTDIYVKLRLEQSVASQHLAILRRANIVITQREGKFIHYALNHNRIANIAQFVSELVNSDDKSGKNNDDDNA
jgi:DNA-binding transcriptional ArsR family regulator